MDPRGIRLNNPGNIRLGAVQWHGQVVPGVDPDFCTFDTPENGIRALAVTLHTYWTSDGVNTIREAISRYAPAADDNDTDAYVTDVATRCGVDPDTAVDLFVIAPKLVPAVIAHEQANYVYPDDVVRAGLSAAGLV